MGTEMKNFFRNKLIAVLITLFLLSAVNINAQNMAFLFNGESSYLSNNVMPANNLYLDGMNNMSVEVWVYLIGDHGNKKIPVLHSVNGTNEVLSVFIENGNAAFKVGDNQVTTENADLSAFRWNHIAGTIDGNGTLKIYLNGKEVEDAVLSVPGSRTSSSPAGFYVGKSDEADTAPLWGLIDEIRIWDYVLMNNHMNASGGNGSPAENFPTSISENLVGRWSFSTFDDPVEDLSVNDNHLNWYNIEDIVESKNPNFLVVNTGVDEVTDNELTSLREAIIEVNTNGGNRTVFFYLPGSDRNITVNTDLPDVAVPAFFNGLIQEGVTISSAGAAHGINISGGSTVKGLGFNGFPAEGLIISGDGNVVESNSFSGNGTGILIT
jgi:hypothetical protein